MLMSFMVVLLRIRLLAMRPGFARSIPSLSPSNPCIRPGSGLVDLSRSSDGDAASRTVDQNDDRAAATRKVQHTVINIPATLSHNIQAVDSRKTTTEKQGRSTSRL